jgi:hypothetical protein
LTVPGILIGMAACLGFILLLIIDHRTVTAFVSVKPIKLMLVYQGSTP